MPNMGGGGVGGVAPCGFKLTGQGATVLPGSFPAGGVASDNAVMIGLLTG
jgi:hypothetical protein